MALYSVWDWNKNLYRVHADTLPVSVGVDPSPPQPTGVHLLGAIPYDHAKVLPPAARFMGLSHVPRGEVVRSATNLKELLGLGAEPGSSSVWTFAAIATAALVVGYVAGRMRS
jgi:hypothetical protein